MDIKCTLTNMVMQGPLLPRSGFSSGKAAIILCGSHEHPDPRHGGTRGKINFASNRSQGEKNMPTKIDVLMAGYDVFFPLFFHLLLL